MIISENIKLRYIIVLSGNMLALVCGFIVSIVGTHIINPVDYGFYKAFLIALQMLATFSHLGFHYTLGREFALTNTVEENRKLNSSAIIIFLFLYFTVLITISLISTIGNFFAIGTLPDYVILGSVFTFGMWLMNFT